MKSLHYLLAVCVMVFLTAVAAQPAPGADTEADRLLLQARQASGGAAWDAVGSLAVDGRFTQGGQTGTFSRTSNLWPALYVETTLIDRMQGAQGWDGKRAWSLDSAGQLLPGTGRTAMASGIGQAYRSAYLFFLPTRWPASRHALGQEVADGTTYDLVDITPQGAEPFRLWIDERTHLIARLEETGGVQPHRFYFSDYRRVGDLLMPHIMRDTIGEGEFDTVWTTESVTVGAALPVTRFTAPPSKPLPDPFPPGKNSVKLPIRLIDNHIFLEASINDGPPQQFLFDTGAVAIIDRSHASSIGIGTDGRLGGSGFGAATLELGKARAARVTLGGFVLRDQAFLSLDLAPVMQSLDVDIAGLLGVELAQQAVVTIDYARGTMELVRPSHFIPPSGAKAIALKFNEHLPAIDAVVDGIAGEFEVDTGSAGGLTLMTPFVQQNRLVERHGARQQAQSSGAGGTSTNLLARMDSLQIGTFALSQLVANLSTDRRGAAASTREAGNIGGAILQRFTVTFDYPHQRMYLVQNTHFAEPESVDRSGLRLKRDAQKAILISYVAPGGPAAEAGVRAGDRLLQVDEWNFRQLTLPSLRNLFRRPAGTDVMLTIERAGEQSRVVSVKLRDPV